MKTLTHTLRMILAGAWALGVTLPSVADHARGWGGEGVRDHRPHWKEHRHHRQAYTAPVVVLRPSVVVHRPPVVVDESPVLYERRAYYGPTCYTRYERDPTLSLSLTPPLR